MLRRCEICALAAGPGAGEGRARLRRLLFGARVVLLCDAHAERARESGAESPEELRALFVEDAGRRSLLSRRAPLDRRLFPPRPEGRRRSFGRRAGDVEP